MWGDDLRTKIAAVHWRREPGLGRRAGMTQHIVQRVALFGHSIRRITASVVGIRIGFRCLEKSRRASRAEEDIFYVRGPH